jgi:6-phosphofructokinase 1
MLIEIMGRYAGWLTLHSGIAGGGDVILIPEIPYSFDEICRVVRERNKKGKRFSIVVVSEGAKPIGGDQVVKAHDNTSTDPIRLGGIAQLLSAQIQEATGIDARATVLGHLQRGGSPSAFDRVLSTRFGHAAADLAARGKAGRMVALQGRDIVDIAISRAVSKLKLVPLDSSIIAAAKAVGTSFGV